MESRVSGWGSNECFSGPGWPSFWLDPQLLGLCASQVNICNSSYKRFTYMHYRMVVGATTSGVFLVAYVLAMEMVGPKFRLITVKFI